MPCIWRVLRYKRCVARPYSLEAPDVIIPRFYVGGISDIVFCEITFQPACKGVLFQLRQTVHRTPMTISAVQLIGADFIISSEGYIFPVIEKFGNVAVIRSHIRKVILRSFGYGKSEIISYQPFQSFKHPKKNQVFFGYEFVRNVRIGNPVFGNGICCQNDKPSCKAVGFIVQRFRRAVPEAYKS